MYPHTLMYIHTCNSFVSFTLSLSLSHTHTHTHAHTHTQVLALIEDRGFRLEKPSACPDSVYGAMYQCWSLEPTNRPTFMDLHSMLSTSDDFKGVPHSELYALTKDMKKAMTTV